MMSRLATVECNAIVSNYLLRSGNALGEIVKEYKGDSGLWRDNTHCVGSTISREKPENDSHLQMLERFAVMDSDLSHNMKYVTRYLPVSLRMRMRMRTVRNWLPPPLKSHAPPVINIYTHRHPPLGEKHDEYPLTKKNPI